MMYLLPRKTERTRTMATHDSIRAYTASGPDARPEVVRWWDDLAEEGQSIGEVNEFGMWVAWDGGHARAMQSMTGQRLVVSFLSAREARAYFDATSNDYTAFITGEDV
jgi:hypothetical protein